MNIEDNFKRQKSIYLFYTILPFLLFCELTLYVYSDSKKSNLKILSYVGLAVLLIESVMVIIQIVTRKKLQKKFSELSEAERVSFRTRPLLVGSILVNQSFVVEYRMFRKRIIPIRDIYIAKYKEEESDSRAGAIRVSFVLKRIILLREGKKRILLKVPAIFIGEEPLEIVNSINNAIKGKNINEKTKDIYEKYDGDYPFYGYFLVALFGLYCLLQWLIHPIMNLFTNKDYNIQNLLFHLGYDRYFQMGVYVIIGIVIILGFIWKYMYWGINLDSVLSNFIGISILIYVMIALMSVVDYGDISTLARKDYKDYQKENYQYIETKFIYCGDYFFRYKGNVDLREFLEEMNIELLVFKSCNTNEYFLYACEKNESKIIKEKEYQMKFLENMHLIVDGS